LGRTFFVFSCYDKVLIASAKCYIVLRGLYHKPFTPVINSVPQKARVFFTASHFQLSLIFSGKANEPTIRVQFRLRLYIINYGR
jgi:hypothetical protein